MGSAKTAVGSIEVLPNRDSDTSASLYKGGCPTAVMGVETCLHRELSDVESFATFGFCLVSTYANLDAPSLIPMRDFIEGKPRMRGKLLILAIIGTEIFVSPLIGSRLCFIPRPFGKIFGSLMSGT